jgi:hypothetical protein
MTTMIFRTICERHSFRPFVGSEVVFALDYYECPDCVREEDGARWHPCCSRVNIDCCGHDDGPTAWTVTIDSPNFCAGRHVEQEPPF